MKTDCGETEVLCNCCQQQVCTRNSVTAFAYVLAKSMTSLCQFTLLQMPRKDLAQHCEENCPERPTSCPYDGCKVAHHRFPVFISTQYARALAVLVCYSSQKQMPLSTLKLHVEQLCQYVRQRAQRRAILLSSARCCSQLSNLSRCSLAALLYSVFQPRSVRWCVPGDVVFKSWRAIARCHVFIYFFFYNNSL